jgi:hypothetical protein
LLLEEQKIEIDEIFPMMFNPFGAVSTLRLHWRLCTYSPFRTVTLSSLKGDNMSTVGVAHGKGYSPRMKECKRKQETLAL